MRILVVSDAWAPQVNGVVTSLQALVRELRGLGHLVKVLSPQEFNHVPCPSYPEIPLAWDLWRVGPAIRDFRPDCVHLATEGPLGWAARRWLKRRGLAFSSAIHTRFPEYVHTRWPRIPLAWGYAFLRRFHRPSEAVLVSTERLRDEFATWGLGRLHLWRKGVDTKLFRPQGEAPVGPVFLYVGRLAAEKNLRAFLDLDLPGEKRVVGDGPERAVLERDYPEARFLGFQQGETLARSFASASVLVFPSRTDTYGLVMLEALACGTPVAAFPVTGPLDVLEAGVTGIMDESLERACLGALRLDRAQCAERAARQSWRASALEFLACQPLVDGTEIRVEAPQALPMSV
ncbi:MULTISPECIES: glycosyltransferase family 1 protein [unclassified Pseudomonas]|uniref:glycosyltransferase family 4 protein n=1 Tax=unclassified Pseudomonas TaxID=196821 RepID=UPI00244C40CC|nr:MULTISPECIES: glycosyltransferase family 1 protein [unclassified Pseudomonas]MDH0897381.1 glycosyltransferase family 1 protein [Pseudomonas sp. GD03875]MDH1066791.1 glycosyltransferase family 1 protein [Pseudomonas sp. GD03985]